MADKNYIVVSSYTKGTPYKSEADRLQETLEKHEVPYCITALEDLGSWRENCRATNHVIMDGFARFPDKDIVWLDADARVRKYPVLFDNYMYDIGLYFPEWPPGSGKMQCRTGTMYLKNTERVRRFFGDYTLWRDEGEANFEAEKDFGSLVKQSGLNFDPSFPGEYCMIFHNWLDNVDHSLFTEEGIEPGFKLEDVVILQNMSMKRYIRKVNRRPPRDEELIQLIKKIVREILEEGKNGS